MRFWSKTSCAHFHFSLSYPGIYYWLKPLLSIFLLLVLLFNFYGYRLVFDYMENRDAVAVDAKLDQQDFNDDELVSIKTALQLPYYTPSQDFERVYGSVEVDGVVYNYVKRRVFNDSLELLCLPDYSRAEMTSEKNKFFKLSIGGSSSQHKSTAIQKIVLPEFFQTFNFFVLQPYSCVARRLAVTAANPLPEGYSLRAKQPPRSMI